MITIIVVPRAINTQETDEFFKSLTYSHSGENPYEIIYEKLVPDFEDKVTWVKEPSADSEITITLPDDCLILGNSWDKYIRIALDEGLPQGGFGKSFVPTWEGLVQRRMALESRRPPMGVLPDLKVVLATE